MVVVKKKRRWNGIGKEGRRSVGIPEGPFNRKGRCGLRDNTQIIADSSLFPLA